MLQIRNLKKTYQGRKKVAVFNNFNLKVGEGEFTSIFGPNGCGKTTLLDIVSGITPSDGGEISFGGKPTNSLRIGFVFQDYKSSLFPWLMAKDNIAFPLKISGLSKREIDLRVERLKCQFGCRFKLNLYPYQLSGGQQQFISLLRSLIINPELFLLDEPFSSLDYQTTLLMLEKLAEMWEKLKVTTLFVSHEIDDAIFLGQKVVLLSNKPTKVLKIFRVGLPYPRKISMMETNQFNRIKSNILTLYRKQIGESFN